MNTKELRDKIGQSSFNAIVKHPYYKEHLYSSHHDPVFHHETSPSGAYSTVKANVAFGGKKKTITFQYHKNKVHNAHYALDDKHIRSHKEVNESMENIQELSAKVIQSYLNKIKAKKRAEQQPAPVSEAKIGDKVQVTHGSQKGLVGHVGEIRKGVAKGDHTYTIDYDDNGNRQSVQVKKAHTKKVMAEGSVGSILTDKGKKQLAASVASKAKDGNIPFTSTVKTSKGTEVTHGYTDSKGNRHVTKKEVNEASIHSSYMKRGGSGMVGKKPNASDMATHGTYNVTVKHDQGDKTYKLKNMKDSKHAQNTAMKIHRKDNPSHKIDTTSAEKVEVKEEVINEISKKVMGRYIEKAATSMATAAFGQGQSSASRQPPREQDQKTGMKRMTGIARATSRLTKEETDTSEKLEMAETQLHFIGYAADEILNYIKTGGEVEEWYQNKLSKVHSDMESLHSYVEGESRRVGMKEEAEYKAHAVSVQLKHPAYEGVHRKIVKVNATSTKHAEDIVATHYGRRGFKVHKVDYSKVHKEQFPKSQEQMDAEEVKKEDSKVKKIAKAVKEAIK